MFGEGHFQVGFVFCTLLRIMLNWVVKVTQYLGREAKEHDGRVKRRAGRPEFTFFFCSQFFLF